MFWTALFSHAWTTLHVLIHDVYCRASFNCVNEFALKIPLLYEAHSLFKYSPCGNQFRLNDRIFSISLITPFGSIEQSERSGQFFAQVVS
jgi:hypothetical protein